MKILSSTPLVSILGNELADLHCYYITQTAAIALEPLHSTMM